MPRVRERVFAQGRHLRPRQIGLALLYLGTLCALVVWEYHERLEVLSSECTLRDETRSGFYSRPYTELLQWARPATTGHVVTVSVPEDLEEVQSNVCLARAYLADVVRAVTKSNPSVVVLDKFFSPNTCSRAPEQTQSLQQAVRGAGGPVVVGESTDGVERAVSSACLVKKPQLDFGSDNVVHGLTRLNMEAERLPLRWLVLPSDPEKVAAAVHGGGGVHGGSGRGKGHGEPEGHGAEPEPVYVDTLSLAAVKAYDPDFVSRWSVRRLIEQDDHAYSSLDFAVPDVSTTEVLCDAGDDATRRRWGLNCVARPLPVRLLGKVVVIGAENRTDLKTVVGRHLYGFQLQAAYIESLLSGDYLRSLPLATSFVLFAAYVFLIEGIPVILAAYRPHWRNRFLLRYAFPRRRYVWVVFWTAALITGSALLAFALRFLPPLLVYGDILFLAITRLMYFSAESAEHPLLHAHGHAHRKEKL